jgi:hypothetical protein
MLAVVNNVRMIGGLQYACSASGGGNMETSFLVVFFGHQVSNSRMKNLGLTFTGWQWWISIHLLKALSRVYWNFLQGENP